MKRVHAELMACSHMLRLVLVVIVVDKHDWMRWGFYTKQKVKKFAVFYNKMGLR